MRQLAKATRQPRSRGFTLFEFAVAATIMAILAGVLLQRLGAYRAQAELVAVERIVAVMRTALTLKAGELRSNRREQDIAKLAGMNPFDLLSERPANYLGEYFAPDTGKLVAGNWYFDRKSKCLVYLLPGEKRFPRGMQNTLSFKVELSRLPSTTAKRDTTPDATSVTLIQVNR
jgi:prepilin-type N-terminal cleavage/methylation domain-containing protein